MYASRDRGSFIAVVSIDPDSFDYLREAFSRCYTVKSGMGKRGRPPKFIFKHAVLACLLHFCMAAVESKTLCELFGVPPATLSHVANRPTSESSSCQPVVLYHFNGTKCFSYANHNVWGRDMRLCSLRSIYVVICEQDVSVANLLFVWFLEELY
ncbi:hypothetical protein JG688_00014871 [Phytophthora aleatoria]|uniref:Uncharacterized protein n=1 Tax=Phytophthora aleatoria TaxID=2496075 RepID=A0A8J5IUJ6_9STRA|nr:hypothetical protein JG688_00014871 [Phytophthora aleatoria]